MNLSLCVCVYILFSYVYFFPVNGRETLLMSQGHGGQAEGHTVGWEGGGGALFKLLGVQLVCPHFLQQLTA